MKIYYKIILALYLGLPLVFCYGLYFEPPFLKGVLAFIPAIWFIVLAIAFKGPWLKTIYICLACILFTVVGANMWYEKHKPQEFSTVITGTIATNYHIPDPIRGYWSKPLVNVTAQAICGGDNIYDVTYTTDAKGRRISYPAIDAKEAVVLFGDSYARGEGLDDNQTFAWLLGEMSHGQYQVFNYAFHGYGPHQALALLENGLDENLSGYRKITFIYNLIGSQVRRSAGLGKWDSDGPHYVLENGKLSRAGTFKDRTQKEIDNVETGTDSNIVAEALRKSALWTRLHDAYADRFGYRAELLRAVLESSFNIMKKQWPNSRLIILAWPGAESLAGPLARKGIEIVKVEPMLPEYASNEYHYKYQCDRHPNPKAAALVADGLLRALAK